MPQQCAEPPPRPPPTGAKQGHNPPTTPPPQPDSPGKPPKPHPPNPTHPRGSSPHTRGAHEHRIPARSRRGIIPAYAGSTRSCRAPPARCRDHPRIRGEHLEMPVDAAAVEGSSPHTRGAPQEVSDDAEACGIIPAYAGSTRRSRSPRARLADHPRIRGEHCRSEYSPTAPGWIIPAYAGSTPPSGRFCACPRDHPRIRGEHAITMSSERSKAGSSPHTRGARFAILLDITLRPDHPRIRGEHK